ncbi:MAG: PASTA domain-containing protein, partial [Eubacteriales bacterium]
QTFFPTTETEDPFQHAIPNVVGSLYADIQNDKSTQFVYILGDTITDDAEEGIILSQSPPANSLTSNPSEIIRVVVSGGPEVILMINIMNQEYFKAKVELQNMGLDVATPTYEHHDEIAANHVISYSPSERTELKPGDMVDMVLSLGPETRKVTLPNLIGENRTQAENKLDLLNLVPVIKEEYSNTIPAGQVMDQHPTAGTEIAEGTEINLQVSLGVDPDTIPELVTKLVTVPIPDSFQMSGDSIQIRVTMDDKIVYVADVDPVFTTAVSFDVEGNGRKELFIYFNGVPEGSQVVEFD